MAFNFSWMVPAILMLLLVGAHQSVKPWWVKAIAKLAILGLAIATLEEFFRSDNWGGIVVLVLLALACIAVWAWRHRRRKKRDDKKPTEHHHHHHHETV